MSSALKLPIPFIRGMARKASYAYKLYTIKKRDGSDRQIAHPARPLKGLQRWLLRHVIEPWPVHDAAYGYVKGRNIHDHASRHASSRYLLRLDFVSFFPSIGAGDIAAFLARYPVGTVGWNDEDRGIFAQLVCRSGALTIGSPTSPALSNALCYGLDHQCSMLAADRDLIYTRYADDIFFSTARPNVLRDVPNALKGIVANLDIPAHLKLNDAKQRHSSKRGRRQVTGIVLSSDGRAVLGRGRKRFIRHQIHRLEALRPTERSSLRGLIAFAMDVEPQFVNALILKYGRKRVVAARTP
ncbi:MAG: retron St85 family RNA-directed DNA polymerase [Pirellulales bacterium]